MSGYSSYFTRHTQAMSTSKGTQPKCLTNSTFIKYALCKPFSEDFDKHISIAQVRSNALLSFDSDLLQLQITGIPYPEEDKHRVKLVLNHQLSKYHPEVKVQWI